jgi:hypothetical protein
MRGASVSTIVCCRADFTIRPAANNQRHLRHYLGGVASSPAITSGCRIVETG